MAIRRTIYKLKNNQTNAGVLPSGGVEMGEPLVNLYNGILFFSGTTGGNFVPSDNNPNYFEVGSNLYNLGLRNQITRYQNITGAGLVGKFLSGTTTGFVLADISAIAGSVDSFTTGATWAPNTLTLSLNQGKPSVAVTINSFNGITLFGSNTINGSLTVTGTTNLNGQSFYNQTVSGLNPLEIANVSFVTANTSATDSFVTGATWSPNTLTLNLKNGRPSVTTTINSFNNLSLSGTTTATGNISPFTGCTYNLGSSTNRWNELWVRRVRVGTCTTDIDDDGTQFIVTVSGTSSGATFNLNGGDLRVAGDLLPVGDLTYNIGEPANRWNTVYASNISASAITVTNLTPNRVVYTNGSSVLATETGFEYDQTTDRMTVGAITVNNPSGTTSFIGQGGLVIGSGGSTNTPGVGDLTVHGNLIVYGTGTTIATNELYVEDPQITLNYNPTGNTSVTSIASGIRIQNGNGLTSGNTDVYLTIAQMNTFTGGAVTEYTGPTGYANRAFLTQLNDIVIRNTNLNNGVPNGVRVLAEFDFLDGGTY